MDANKLILFLLVLLGLSQFAAAQGYGRYPVVYSNPLGELWVVIAIVVILIALIAFVGRYRHISIRMILSGAALAPIGMLVWLFGDFGGGETYVWTGVAILIIGILVWITGDVTGGAFDRRIARLMKPTKLVPKHGR